MVNSGSVCVTYHEGVFTMLCYRVMMRGNN